MSAPETVQWETFCDHSYYDMWCVRKVGDRTFGQGFHLMRQAEAQSLCDLLNTRAATASNAAMVGELVATLAALEKWFDTDPEILAAMPADERADNARQLAKIRAILARAKASEVQP